MDVVLAIKTVRDFLRDNLPDSYIYTGANARDGSMWIFGNEPHSSPKYPQIEILKIDNPSEVLSIGKNYAERERAYLNIFFYSKNGFKITIDEVEYVNTQLVEKYMSIIKTTLKAKFADNSFQDVNIKGYKHMNTSKVSYSPDTQLYFGAISIMLEYFVSCT